MDLDISIIIMCLEVYLLPLAAVLILILSFCYLISFLKKDNKEKSGYITLFAAFILMGFLSFQLVSSYNLFRAQMALPKTSPSDIDEKVIPYYLKAGKYSPFVAFKTQMYEIAYILYSEVNTKENFDKNKLYDYVKLAARYKIENLEPLMLYALLYGDYDIALDAAYELKSYYFIAQVLIIKGQYNEALLYADKALSDCMKDKKCRTIDKYILKGVIYKNLGDEKSAKMNFEAANKNAALASVKERIKNAEKNYKTFYKNQWKASKDIRIKSYGY